MLFNEYHKQLSEMIYQPSFLRLHELLRFNEFRADNFAVKAIMQAVYNPIGGIVFMRMGPESSEKDASEVHLSIHPLVSL